MKIWQMDALLEPERPMWPKTKTNICNVVNKAAGYRENKKALYIDQIHIYIYIYIY